MTNMHSVRDPADIATVAALAYDIWPRHYVPIIGQAQTDYMLARFQSQAAIGQQIADGYQYYLVMADIESDGPIPGDYSMISFQNFKHLRKTPHTHDPVDDARGNAEALLAMVQQHGLRISL